MESLKNALNDIMKHLEELEAAARKLVNQNFADIAATAKGRVQQLCEHPDLELAHKELSGEHDEPKSNGEPLPFDPHAGVSDTYTGEGTAPITPPPNAAPVDPKLQPAEAQK